MESTVSTVRFINMLRATSILICSPRPFDIIFSLLRFLPCAFFMFSTLACINKDTSNSGNFMSVMGDALILLVHITLETSYLTRKDNVMAIMGVLTEEPMVSEKSPIIEEYFKNFRYFCKLMVIATFLMVLWGSISFSTDHSGECVHLTLGHIWGSENHVYFSALNVFYVIFTTTTMFRWYVMMFLMVIRIRCQIRLLCLDLKNINDVVSSSRTSSPSKISVARSDGLEGAETKIKTESANKSTSLQTRDNIHEFQKRLKEKQTEDQIICFLRNAVQQHIEIIKNVSGTEDTFRYSTMFFTQVGAVIIALAIPQLTLNEDLLSVDTFKLVAVVMNVGMGCIGLFNYTGQILLDEAECLRQALYNCDWTEKHRSLRRGLLIMQIMASKPLKLTIGGIYTLGMETFTNVLSATYTYTSVTFSLQ